MAAKKRNLKDIRFRKRKFDPDFKPDAKVSTWAKTSKLTMLQRQRLLKWLLYVGVIVLTLVIQDVVMSQFDILGGTTDLPVAVMLLITVIEGTEVGSLFVLVASVLYYFSGSAPGAYCVALMTALGVICVIFRQMYWHRSKGSIILCAAIAVFLYETSLFVVGLLMELTAWSRLGVFLLNGAFSAAALIPLYPLIHKIGLIGGNTWKE